MRSRDFRRTEAALYRFIEKRNEVERLMGQAEGSIHKSSVGAHQKTGCHTSSVERGAILLADTAPYLDDWRREVDAIQAVKDRAGRRKRKFMRLKYFEAEKKNYKVKELAKELGVTPWTVRKIREDVVGAARVELERRGV